MAGVPADEERVILATGRYIGEGFDDGRLDTLFLTLPVSWHGTIAHHVGRVHRLYDGKREVRVYDYADLNVPMLSRMFDRRCRGYEAVGYMESPSAGTASACVRPRPPDFPVINLRSDIRGGCRCKPKVIETGSGFNGTMGRRSNWSEYTGFATVNRLLREGKLEEARDAVKRVRLNTMDRQCAFGKAA
jgi:superfamily II DNA or RNA helicase